MHPADEFIRRSNGPLGIGRTCRLCGFGEFTRKPPAGTRGRGWGLREGNKLRGLLIQHIKAEHPDAIK